MVRLVKIEVDPAMLPEFIFMLKEQMNTAVQLEEGVLEYHVVAEKNNPYLFTLIEIYKDNESYLSHIKSPHFLKYKKDLLFNYFGYKTLEKGYFLKPGRMYFYVVSFR